MSAEFDFESCDGLSSAEITVTPVDGPYPAMVRLEFDGSDLLDVDAELLASKLMAAANRATKLSREAFGTAKGVAS